MAFPGLALLDDFEVADGDLDGRAGWQGVHGLRIVRGALVPQESGEWSFAERVESFGSAAGLWFTFASDVVAGSLYAGLNDGSMAVFTGDWMALYDHDDNEIAGRWPGDVGGSFRAGDGLALTINGRAAEVHIGRASTGRWALALRGTLPTTEATGRPWIGMYGAALDPAIAAFGGGPLSSGATISHYDGSRWTDRGMHVYAGSAWAQAAGLGVL